jgi:hypothetical protein
MKMDYLYLKKQMEVTMYQHNIRSLKNITIFFLVVFIIDFIFFLCYSLPFALAQTAIGITDAQAGESIQQAIVSLSVTPLGFGSGIIILSLLMTLLRWGRLNNLFYKIPKRYRSFIPIVLGAVIGLFKVFVGKDPVTLQLVLNQLFNGALIIGGGQQVLYQNVKGTLLGNLISSVLKTKKPSGG